MSLRRETFSIFYDLLGTHFSGILNNLANLASPSCISLAFKFLILLVDKALNCQVMGAIFSFKVWRQQKLTSFPFLCCPLSSIFSKIWSQIPRLISNLILAEDDLKFPIFLHFQAQQKNMCASTPAYVVVFYPTK